MSRTKISSNGGYSYPWGGPYFRQVPSGNLYFTAIANNSEWRVFLNDSSTFDTLDTCPELDDHNAPAILVQPNKDKYAFATRHLESNVTNLFKATSGISFTDIGNITHPDGNLTYSRVLDYENTVVELSRSGVNDWRFKISEDWCANWSGSRRLLNLDDEDGQKYVVFSRSSTPNIYHMAVYGHPGSDWRQMCYGTVDLDSGDISTPSQGVIANLDGTNLPLTESSLDDIVPTTGTEIARLFDVGEAHGKPVVLYAKYDGDPDTTGEYWYAYLDSGTWYHVEIVATGAHFGGNGTYFGGATINKIGGNKIVLAREASGTSYIDLYPINSNLTLGTKTQLQSDATYRLVRPYYIEDSDDVVYQELRVYSAYTGPYTIWVWKEDL